MKFSVGGGLAEKCNFDEPLDVKQDFDFDFDLFCLA